MKKSSKVFVTVGIVILFLIIMGIIGALQGPGGGPTGIIGIILFIGLIVAIRAVWKYQGPTKETHQKAQMEKDPYTLDKSE